MERPHVTIFSTMSVDGRIASSTGYSVLSCRYDKARDLSRRLGYPLVEGSEIIEEVERHGEDLYCRYNLCES